MATLQDKLEMMIDRQALTRPAVRVEVPAKALYDFDKITAVLQDVLEELGCRACCSGHDIRFDIARNFAVDINGKVSQR